MAHILEWRVRELSTTEGTADIVLDGAMRGSLAFSDVMTTGDTCDYVVHYDDTFEAGLGTMGSDGKLQRTTVYRTRHANGTIDATKLSLAIGTKTVIMSARGNKFPRTDVDQAFTSGETAQLRANVPPFESGTRLIFQQTSAPVGWTKDVSSHDDKALRLVTGTVSSGGSVNFSTLYARTATDNFTVAQGNLPSVSLTTTIAVGAGAHAHSASATNLGITGVPGTGIQSGSSAIIQGITVTVNSNTLPAMTGSTPLGGSATPLSAPLDMRVKYADAIIASAD